MNFLKHSRHLLLILLFLLILLVVYLFKVGFLDSSTRFTINKPESEEGRGAVEKIRQECFDEVGKITEKDATRFNEFRSVSDFRLFKYRECLKEGGITEGF